RSTRDWSSDVCSSDLEWLPLDHDRQEQAVLDSLDTLSDRRWPLLPRRVQAAQDRRVGLDAVPQVLEAEVLVGGVLVVVVVGDGKADDRAPGLLLEQVHGHAAGE